MLNKLSSINILKIGYALLACLYLFATVNNSFDNFYGNRNFGSIGVLIFSSVMLIGLLKLPKYFTKLSVVNFIVGLVAIAYINILGLPSFNAFLLVIFCVGVFGLLISVKASKAASGL